MREGRLCAVLFQAARKSLILHGDMSEWLKEHAWKTNPASCTEWYRNTSSRNEFNDFPSTARPWLAYDRLAQRA